MSDDYVEDGNGALASLNAGLQSGAISFSDNDSRWELDVAPFLDRVYHELLGEVVNDEGVWVRDSSREKVMNSLGASEFVQEISIRLSIHQQLSELQECDIVEIASIGAENYADKMEDNFEKWEIFPSKANFMSIGWRLFHVLFENLMISKGAGMRKHRERAKNPFLRVAPQMPNEGVL